MLATTTDARLLFDVGQRGRDRAARCALHAQTAVDFWQRAYVFGPGFQYPALRTGDRELGPLVNVTGGWTLRIGSASDADADLLGARLRPERDDRRSTSTTSTSPSRISAIGGVTLEADL